MSAGKENVRPDESTFQEHHFVEIASLKRDSMSVMPSPRNPDMGDDLEVCLKATSSRTGMLARLCCP
jgi:hypothetical protein